jgi:DNA polymerase III alpha subunit
VLSAAELRVTRDGARVRVAGLVVCRQRPGTAKGFVFMLLEDETGLVNVVLRPDFYEAERSVLRGEPYLCFRGTVQIRSGSLNLIAEAVVPLTKMPGITRLRPSTGDPSTPIEPGAGVMPSPSAVPNGRSSAAARLPAPASHDFH